MEGPLHQYLAGLKLVDSSVEAPIVVECADDPFEDLDEILGDYANIRKQITGNEITGKQMVVHVDNSSIVDDVLDLEMIFRTEGVGLVGKFKKVEVDADNESEEERSNRKMEMMSLLIAMEAKVLAMKVKLGLRRRIEMHIRRVLGLMVQYGIFKYWIWRIEGLGWIRRIHFHGYGIFMPQ
ncbi:hypothetical protein Tco_0209287 [Tanacetum coccineum]